MAIYTYLLQALKGECVQNPTETEIQDIIVVLFFATVSRTDILVGEKIHVLHRGFFFFFFFMYLFIGMVAGWGEG